MFLIRETVVTGSSTGTVKNYYKANNFLVIMDIRGDDFKDGAFVTGLCSGFSKRLTNFQISDFADLNYDDLSWEEQVPFMLVDEEGEVIVTDSAQYADSVFCDDDVKDFDLDHAIYQDTGEAPDEFEEAPEDEPLAEDDI